MIVSKNIKVGRKKVSAVLIGLQSKKLILITGSKGYIMCGYLNLNTANKCGDVAVKITGVSTIKDSLAAKVAACSRGAEKMGIKKGQNIRQVLKVIA